jgi:uncharacterized protein YydD (DUF2326 family)
MRLIKLSANKSSFRTVEFNRSGLSFVLGQKKTQDDTARNRTRTYNGVGKSLMLELIHYCLASNKNEAFKKHLDDWEFSLTIEVDNTEHLIARSAGDDKDISLDGKEITLKNLREWLFESSFETVSGVKGLTFRSLISQFIRSGRAAYERFDRADEGDAANPYYALVRNAYLLGLDLHLAEKKQSLRNRYNSLSKTMKQLETDPLFADIISEDKAGIELVALREDAARLEERLRRFQVAEDYASIQSEANSLKKETELLRRDLVKTTDAIAQISRSLETKRDIDPALVMGMYEEAGATFPDVVKHRIDEVLAFQKDLLTKRIFRLTAERQSLERRKAELEGHVARLSSQLEDRIQFLGTHVALDEYLAVNERLNDNRVRIAKLEASNEQRGKVARELTTIKRDLANQTLKTSDYLDSARDLVGEANSLFRTYTKALYGNRTSGLTISNDTGENTLRYKIDAHISSDAAEGINEAKIFCYDLMILALRRRHNIEFLMHDSTLFQPVDPRQRLAMFKLANEVTQKLGIQYIATLNEHDVEAMKTTDESEREAFDTIFEQSNIVLKLTDQSPKERLLGTEIDMNYWQKKTTKSESLVS